MIEIPVYTLTSEQLCNTRSAGFEPVATEFRAEIDLDRSEYIIDLNPLNLL